MSWHTPHLGNNFPAKDFNESLLSVTEASQEGTLDPLGTDSPALAVDYTLM